ncbi:MAG: hypothetical protein IJ347_10480 [Faecalibacterium sp.]|nr:hypothetical protein [Faecalibacterium sp.]
MDLKKTGKKLLFPPLWLTVLLTIASAAGLTITFINGLETHPAAYVVYVLSFYTLFPLAAFLVTTLPKRFKAGKQQMLANPLMNRYMTDSSFHAKVSLCRSFSINLLYVAIHILSWYLYRSWWFVCLAVYYGILSTMRFVLVGYVRLNPLGADRRDELKRSLFCSHIMLLLNLFLSGAVLMMVYQNKGYKQHGILIYVMALYTFYSAIHAIIDLVRYRSFESPVMSTAKSISMASALVSMLNLETAMFAEFGASMSKENQQLMIMLTGAGIAVSVIAMAVHMILRCRKELKSNTK